MEGVYELSAISYHAYPYVADKYVLMASGSSIGDGYGPMVVATRPMEPEEIKGKQHRHSRHDDHRVPGAARYSSPISKPVVVPFDKILDAVQERQRGCRSDYSRSATHLQQERLSQHRSIWASGGRIRTACRCRSAATSCCVRWPPTSRANAAG